MRRFSYVGSAPRAATNKMVRGADPTRLRLSESGLDSGESQTTVSVPWVFVLFSGSTLLKVILSHY